MTQHFDKERRCVGLHGLYTKYQKYVQPLAANYCLQSNLLVTLMLKHDYGTQADTRNTMEILILDTQVLNSPEYRTFTVQNSNVG